MGKEMRRVKINMGREGKRLKWIWEESGKELKLIWKERGGDYKLYLLFKRWIKWCKEPEKESRQTWKREKGLKGRNKKQLKGNV